MSEDKHYAGKLRKIQRLEGQSLEEQCEELCKKYVHEKYHDLRYYESWAQCLDDNTDFFISQGTVFEIYDLEDIDEYETVITKNSEKEYTFRSHFYNAATDLKECLQDELYRISDRNKTSREWQEIYPDVRIVNPDGWDRSNFEYSWNEELISLEEYENRVRESSIVKKL